MKRRLRDYLIGAALLIALVVFLMMFAGCGLVPTERSASIQQAQRESVAGQATSKVVSESVVRPPNVVVEQTAKDGTRLVITQPAHADQRNTVDVAANETSDSQAAAEARSAVSIPFFVKLIGTAVGAALLLAVLWFVRRSAKAVDAAWSGANDMLGGAIHSLRSRITTATDPSVILALKAEEAELQRLRSEMLED